MWRRRIQEGATRAAARAGNSERPRTPPLKSGPETLPPEASPGVAWQWLSVRHVPIRKVLPTIEKKTRAEATTDCDCGKNRLFALAIVIPTPIPNEPRQIIHVIRLPINRF
jgi:hypothetical protein